MGTALGGAPCRVCGSQVDTVDGHTTPVRMRAEDATVEGDRVMRIRKRPPPNLEAVGWSASVQPSKAREGKKRIADPVVRTFNYLALGVPLLIVLLYILEQYFDMTFGLLG